MPISFPVPETRVMARFGLLSTRQEAFCRHFVACGNAAEAARRAGYAERSARQSGHALLERSHIVERVRQIRLLWRQTARAEVQILLARLEQVWQAAAAAEAPHLMLRVVRFQAELSGVSREGHALRPDFWPMPDEDEFGEVAAAAAMTAPGPLAQAVQLGRERAEWALARHEAQAAGPDAQDAPADRAANGVANGAAAAEAERLRAEIEERRRLLEPPAPAPDSDRDLPPSPHVERPFRPAPGFGEEPDIRDDDEAYIDGVEADWMNRLRGGVEPIEPWPDAPTHEDPFLPAQDDPEEDDREQDNPVQADPAQDGPAQDAPPQDEDAEDGPVAPPLPDGAADSATRGHPANGFDPADAVPCAAARLPQAAHRHNGNAADRQHGAPHDNS